MVQTALKSMIFALTAAFLVAYNADGGTNQAEDQYQAQYQVQQYIYVEPLPSCAEKDWAELYLSFLAELRPFSAASAIALFDINNDGTPEMLIIAENVIAIEGYASYFELFGQRRDGLPGFENSGWTQLHYIRDGCVQSTQSFVGGYFRDGQTGETAIYRGGTGGFGLNSHMLPSADILEFNDSGEVVFNPIFTYKDSPGFDDWRRTFFVFPDVFAFDEIHDGMHAQWYEVYYPEMLRRLDDVFAFYRYEGGQGIALTPQEYDKEARAFLAQLEIVDFDFLVIHWDRWSSGSFLSEIDMQRISDFFEDYRIHSEYSRSPFISITPGST